MRRLLLVASLGISATVALGACGGNGSVSIFNESLRWTITQVTIDSDMSGGTNVNEAVSVGPGEDISFEVEPGTYDILISEESATGTLTGDGEHDVSIGSGQHIELETDDAGDMELRQ